MSALLLVVEYLAVAALPTLVGRDPVWLIAAFGALAIAGLARSIATMRDRRRAGLALIARAAVPAAPAST